MELIRKSYEVKAEDASLADAGNGSLSGCASVMGNLDQSNDVIFPGVYTPVLSDFAVNGFVALNHKWRELPIGMPRITEERGSSLYVEFDFHSTDEAQEVRTVCRERIAAGKSVGLSVGFTTDWDYIVYFENGANLLQFAANNGYDISLFDTVALRAHEDWCRGITRVERLMEYSVTPLPCNLGALADEAKALSTKTFLPEGKTVWRPLAEANDLSKVARNYRALAARTQAAMTAGVIL